MKEVTEWDNNPREMWVWDYDTKNKVKAKVVYLCDVTKVTYPVVTLFGSISEAGSMRVTVFKHCAEIEEIEEPKTRRMTNQELSWWLQDGIKDGKHREWIFVGQNPARVHVIFDYFNDVANRPVDDNILIRENGREWHEPLIETDEYKDYLESEKAYNEGV